MQKSCEKVLIQFSGSGGGLKNNPPPFKGIQAVFMLKMFNMILSSCKKIYIYTFRIAE